MSGAAPESSSASETGSGVAAGEAVEAYLLTVIEAAAAPTLSERASLEEFEAAMDEMEVDHS